MHAKLLSTPVAPSFAKLVSTRTPRYIMTDVCHTLDNFWLCFQMIY